MGIIHFSLRMQTIANIKLDKTYYFNRNQEFLVMRKDMASTRLSFQKAFASWKKNNTFLLLQVKIMQNREINFVKEC